MFTQDQIMNISKDEFSKLSAENKELILKILSEFKTDGMSQTLKELWEVDYKEMLMKYNEQEKKLNELQSLSNNIEKDKFLYLCDNQYQIQFKICVVKLSFK